ncbi:hypothetical protein Ae406Ps2_3199 [Pseudonocardia sp. Ae406_Ps2]|nr:hypothetical protein Ae331Ps2_2727c [Pseudonocardia sp. Ae331_Ps2]OLM03199.1 hypothetical protein Ae406Ps2_3199 [Pseudonocardia sp. Ae406_Ps2]OLM11924.1 hypothetical protein Ae505Ps2_2050c [Pseudonocardia sp. Ae505_Ps2]OLM24758.1 hypothetical protein Ae706Ps2_3191 [Pseudonocardia sp. Ae706_Ps2]
MDTAAAPQHRSTTPTVTTSTDARRRSEKNDCNRRGRYHGSVTRRPSSLDPPHGRFRGTDHPPRGTPSDHAA